MGCTHEILRNAADSLSLPLCPGGVRIPVSTTFFREFAGQDSRLGRPPRPSQPGSLQGSPQKGVFLAAETRNVQASPRAVKSRFLLVCTDRMTDRPNATPYSFTIPLSASRRTLTLTVLAASDPSVA